MPDMIDIDGDHVNNIFNMIHTAPLIGMTMGHGDEMCLQVTGQI